MTHCKYCNLPIDFDDEHTSRSGKRIPLDADTRQPHDCIARPRPRKKTTECHNCRQEIFFSPDRRNPATGKLIPQDIFGNHKCISRLENWWYSCWTSRQLAKIKEEFYSSKPIIKTSRNGLRNNVPLGITQGRDEKRRRPRRCAQDLMVVAITDPVYHAWYTTNRAVSITEWAVLIWMIFTTVFF